MKKTKIYVILIAMIAFVACSDDDFVSKIITDLENNTLIFSYEGGEKTFLLESNEEWTIGEIPDWVTVVVDENPVGTDNAPFGVGVKEVKVTVEENSNPEARTAELMLVSASQKIAKLLVIQKVYPIKGYWILSEGYFGKNDSEMAWFDVFTNKVAQKQYKVINGKELGDTGNALKVYGSKMYVVVTGPGPGDSSQEGTSYIEVLDTKSGKSIKRIPFKNVNGATAKPRHIIFEAGKAYISGYSNEVVRLDTASLELDAHATLSGTLAEGLAYSDGNIYVCNSGQGKDNKISVVDVATMKETKTITTAKNPTGIVAVKEGVLYFNTNYPDYELYKLTTKDDNITKIPNAKASDITYVNNKVFTCGFDWDTYKGAVYEIDVTSDKVSIVNLDLEGAGIPLLMEYHIGVINGSKDLYLTGMGEDVVIFDSATHKVKHALKTGVANGSGVVAVYN